MSKKDKNKGKSKDKEDTKAAEEGSDQESPASAEGKAAAKPTAALREIDLREKRYPLKEIFMQFLEHSDSFDQDISDEIKLVYPEK